MDGLRDNPQVGILTRLLRQIQVNPTSVYALYMLSACLAIFDENFNICFISADE